MSAFVASVARIKAERERSEALEAQVREEKIRSMTDAELKSKFERLTSQIEWDRRESELIEGYYQGRCSTSMTSNNLEQRLKSFSMGLSDRVNRISDLRTIENEIEIRKRFAYLSTETSCSTQNV